MSDFPYRALFFDLGDTLVIPGHGWIPGAQILLSDLRSPNLSLGLISNTGNLTREQLRALLPPSFDFGMFRQDLILLSSDPAIGVEKPDLRIFRMAIDRAGVPPTECLFCTESLPDTLAAQQAGMHAVRVERPRSGDLEALRGALEDLPNL